jgi:hypothetical protein
MGGTLLLCCSLALLLASCSLSRDRRRDAVGIKQVVHPSGLSVTVPESLFVEEIPQGFIVSPPGPKDFRTPQEVTLILEPQRKLPENRWIDTCSVNGRRVYYRIDDDSYDGAGEIYTFSAWIPVGCGYLMLRQVEPGIWPAVPKFDLAWTVIAGASAPDGRN